jgi:hypothetical protein
VPGTPLVTLVHISDLHIGEIDPASGNARQSPDAAWAVKHFPAFDGLIGHQGRSLDELATFCSDRQREGGNLSVIVTGDYTRCGAASEMSVARRYLTSRVDLSPPHRNMVGLQLLAEPVGIPGNHDHWGGVNFPWSGSPSLVPTVRFVPPCPYVLPPRALNKHRSLVLAGIDSDADVGPLSWKRFRAIGAFQSQLGKLGMLLGVNPGNQVRCLLVHHSWHHDGWILKMERGSKQALEQFVVHHGVHFVLTGHTHIPRIGRIGTQSGNPVAYEMCSGTTTQLDYIPPGWKKLIGGMPKSRSWPSNTLILHRVFHATDSVRWESQVWRRSNHAGFQPLPMTHSMCI